MDSLFVGSAVTTISARGELILPEQFCVAVQARSARDTLFIGLHADDPCMLVYDRHSVADHHRALTDLSVDGPDCGVRDMLLRRRLGFVAPAQMDGKGRIAIASWMRSRRGVRQRALLVGMGHHFEVWNLDSVLEQGPGDLIVLAALHLDSLNSASSIIKEDHLEPALSRLGARRRAARSGKSGVPVQPLPAVPTRSDPLRTVGSRGGGR
jgi:MraZ protein